MVSVKTFAPPPLCKKEVLRYAGSPAGDPAAEGLLEECLSFLPEFSYKVCWREMDREALPFSSAALEKDLRGCEKLVLFAATVGLAPDRLTARFGSLSPAKAVMIQALGAERIEALCDAFCRTLGPTRPRFSPGYGDLPLEAQKEIFRLLQPERHLGLTLTESLMMVPSKSVTAIVGLTDTEEKHPNKCALCSLKNCQFRGGL